VARNRLEACVEFVDWVPFTKVASYMQVAEIGIVPQPGNLFINTTIPHKLFQYMASGLPLVVSDAKPLARVVAEGQCGEIFKSGSVSEFTQAVKRIRSSGIDYGKNGKQLVQAKYNWQKTAGTLSDLYRKFEKM